jgi:hypothetical protein
MADIEDQVDRVITRSVTEIEGRGNLKAKVTQTYTPPLDGKTDDYAGFDMRVARGIGELLNKHYFGYTWKSFADTKQGVVGFSIPELMGETLHMVINLKKFDDLSPDLIVHKAGELLERMHLPRGQIDMAAYAFAKANRHKFDFADVKSTGNR